MISSDTVEVSVTYGSRVTFFLRMIGIAEEQKLREKAFGLTDAERDEKEYQMNVDILADLSEKHPTGMLVEVGDGVLSDVPPAGTPAETIRDFFAEKTAVKERIAFYAVRGYFVRLQPSESFL